MSSNWNKISKNKFKKKFSYYKKETKIEINTGNSFQGLFFEKTVVCYDNKKNVIISYQIDWSENLFSCTYLVNEFKYRMSYSSSNLYDRADKKGSLDIKVIKLDE